jgi:hypothetical protein
VGGDVARSAGNLRLAMEYIGDTDIRPEPAAASELGAELVEAGGSAELPRQDSNLRPVA